MVLDRSQLHIEWEGPAICKEQGSEASSGFKMLLTDADIHLLRVFSSVVQCGGFSKAQVVLQVSQPTISNQIATLERRLGFRLCERGRSGFRLTLKGEEIYRSTQQLFSSIETFQNEASALHQVLLGELRLGIADGLLDESPLLRGIIADFSRQAPNVRLNVTSADPSQLEHALNETRLDVVIGDINKAEIYYGHHLYSEEHRLYAAPHHFLCSKESPCLEDIRSARFIRRSYSDLQEARCLSGINAGAVVNTTEAAISLILTGSFVGILPEPRARRFVATSRLEPIESTEMQFTRNISVYRRHNRKMSRLVRAFLSSVAETRTAFEKDTAATSPSRVPATP